MAKEAKEFLCSDESINRYGFRLLTSGGQLKNFKANPVGFFNHNTGGSFWNKDSTYKGPIIRWEGIRTDSGKLYATPVFDEKDDIGKTLSQKVEDDFIRAASIGFKIIETSNDPDLMLKGQQYPTVTKWELMEISVVDIPANTNALALYDADGKRIELNDDSLSTTLSALLHTEKPFPKNNTMKLKLLAGWVALATALGFETGKDQEVETTPEKLSEINAKLVKLADLETEKVGLTTDKEKLNGQVTALTAEKTTLTDKVTNLETQLSGKAAEVISLTDKVKNVETQLTGKVAEITTLTDRVTKLTVPAEPLKKALKSGEDTDEPAVVLGSEQQELKAIFDFDFKKTKLKDNPSWAKEVA